MNLEKLILLLMDHQAIYDVSYIPNSILFMFNGCTHSRASTQPDFAGVFAFLHIARFFAVSLWFWLDSTRLCSWVHTLIGVLLIRNSVQVMIFAPLRGTCSVRTDFCSVISLALINRLHTKH